MEEWMTKERGYLSSINESEEELDRLMGTLTIKLSYSSSLTLILIGK